MEYQELSIPEIQKYFSVSQASAYRMTKSKNWDFVSKPLEKGGRIKMYLLPVSELPNSPEPVSVELPEAVKAEVVQYDETIPKLTPLIKIPEHELHRAQLKAELLERLLSEIDR
ncbi:MAG: hypothetical protein K8S23_02635 [Candidatus Cloacimonetes bacterium]|nr:hypothetical protein [Candidatus Cloacimonadota bacterium]